MSKQFKITNAKMIWKAALAVLLGTTMLAFFQGCNVLSGFSGSAMRDRANSTLNSTDNRIFTGALAGSQPRLGDRNFIASTLSGVFGKNAQVANIILAEVTSQVVIFGGRCDLNQGDCYGNPEGAYVASLPITSILREARKIRACDQILSLADNAGLNNALSLVFQSEPVAAVTAKTVSTAFELFSPGHTLNSGIADELAQSVSGLPEPSSQWIAIFTALCHDPGWETP
jgi:hypothetical protein